MSELAVASTHRLTCQPLCIDGFLVTARPQSAMSLISIYSYIYIYIFHSLRLLYCHGLAMLFIVSVCFILYLNVKLGSDNFLQLNEYE